MIARVHYDDETLGRFLREEPDHNDVELNSHVESCEQCQARLEAITQDGLTWDEAGEMLRADTLDDGVSEGDSPAVSPTAALLDPSEHPGSLGRFGRYEIMELLGRGGMGIVMRGFDPALNRHSAVKVLAPELAGSAAARKRFSREAKSAAAVVHPHIVPIQTVDQHNGLPYLVMPVVEGKSLQQRVDSDGPLETIEVVRIAAQIAEGLAAAHGGGLVHRDIKPANILLENGVERVQITDFGLARAADDASMTRSGVIAGTPQYMSPEQAHGDDIDPRSDMFSLGSVIYFMLTGHSPFRAENTMGVLNRIANDQPRRLRSVDPSIPAWLEAIVMRLLQKKVDKRYPSADALAKELNHCLAELQDGTVPVKASAGFGFPPAIRGLLTVATAGFAIWLASFFLVETEHGTLRIETNADSDVPVLIRQGDKVVERLTVDSDGSSVRLLAGSYVIEIEGEDSSVEIANGRAVVKANGEWISRIQFNINWQDSKDPYKVYQMATKDLRDSRHEDALEKLVWFWENAVRLQPSQSAVRRSFVLSTWLDLGEAYPPALKKLISIRDEIETRMFSKDKIRVRSDDFADFASINETLRQDAHTQEVYDELIAADPEEATRLRFWLPGYQSQATIKAAAVPNHRLAFSILVTRESMNRNPSATDEEIVIAKAMLRASDGKSLVKTKVGTWYPAREDVPGPIMAKHGETPFVLVSDQTMIPWTAIHGHVTGTQSSARGVEARFDEELAEKMRKLTSLHLNMQLALIVNDQIRSTPYINAEIGRDVMIIGAFDQGETGELQGWLSSGLVYPAKKTAKAAKKMAVDVGNAAAAKAAKKATP